jgi:hypothetical protein
VRISWLLSLMVAPFLAGCTTPYSPPVFVAGGHDFPGLVGLVEKSGGRPVDVLLVHGMCTHDQVWANNAIDGLVKAVDSNFKADSSSRQAIQPAAAPAITIVPRTVTLAGGTVNFSALVWSPLTAGLKSQLAYDSTGNPTDCSVPGECKPKRASLNGRLKDVLLNDCLSDAVIYQGESRQAIRSAMVAAITKVVGDSEAKARAAGVTPGPLMLVTESLGSKVTFDALAEMVEGSASPQSKSAGDSAVARLGLVMMGANQLPILGLADQSVDVAGARISAAGSAPQDALTRLLRLADRPKLTQSSFSKLSLVAFTDPNDLLSYRLQASRYASPKVDVTDVLVSNDSTYFGFLERPDTAHTGYRSNAAVASLIACGKPRSAKCR